MLAKIPARDALANEWMALDKLKPASYSQITYEHGRVFYKKTLGGENVGKLYYRDGWKGTEQLLFDPAELQANRCQAGRRRDDCGLHAIARRPARRAGAFRRRRGVFRVAAA